MNVADFNQLDQNEDFETDVCIIGSGPAGLSIAKEFLGSSVRALVIESGDAEPTEFADTLNSIEAVGVPRIKDQKTVRARIFGGTSHLWSGRCGPFDAIDHAERDWVPLSGWPIQMADLAPYVMRASVNLGLGPPCYDESLWEKGLSLKWYESRLGRAGTPPAQELDPNLLRHIFWQFSKDVDDPKDRADPWGLRFGPWFRRLSSENVRILLNATVTQLNLADNGRSVISADVCGKTKKMRRVCAKVFVLCTGGIENVRLLLASNKVAVEGIGNQNDLVGRYFMDHLRWAFATVKPPSQALQDRFCVHRLNHETGTHYYLTGFGLSPAVQKAEGLLNCAGWLMLDPAPDNPWDAVRRMGSTERNLIRDVSAIGANAGIVLRGVGRLARRMPVAHKLEKITLLADVEQRADRDSRVMLSDRKKDFFGVPLPRIDWRTHDQERNTIRRLGLAAAHEFERLGLAKIDLAPWIVDPMGAEGSFEETFHPSGGTRMAREPNAGVVDEHCQVHGVGGLYVAGGSVFPTNSHVNPTLTIVALAIRVADRIKAQHFS